MKNKNKKDSEMMEPTAPPEEEEAGMDQQPPSYTEYPAVYHQPPPNYPGYPQVQPYGEQSMYYLPPEGQFQPLHANPQIVTMQPTAGVTVIKRESDYLCCSIFTMLCCCCPLGLIALVLSFKARDAFYFGNLLLAEKYSKTSRTLNSIAVVIGIICYLLILMGFLFCRR